MVAAKFQIKRKCRICGKEFMAKTIESWNCSPQCSRIAYKRRKDEEARQKKLDEIVKKIPESRDYIKVSEANALFGIGKDTIYRLIRNGAISSVNAGTKMTRVSKEELAKMFPLRSEQIKKQKPEPKLYSLEPKDCYTINEMCEKYDMNDSTAYLQFRKYSIPTRQIGNYVYVPKDEIDKLYK